MAGQRLLTTHNRKPSGPGGGALNGLTSSTNLRFRLRHLVFILLSISALLFFFGGGGSSSRSTVNLARPISTKERTKLLAFCPWSTRTKHVPTIILTGTHASPPTENRTYFVTEAVPPASPDTPSAAKAALSPQTTPASFLPYAYPPRDLRLAQTLAGAPANAPKPGQGRLGLAIPDDEPGEQFCKMHAVPSSPRPAVPATWKPSSVMFGMSTTPDRVLWNLPVWANWVPARTGERGPAVLDPTKHVQTSQLPLVLVVTPPPNPTEQLRTREAVDEANGMGMYVEMRPREADRFETRYFGLAEEMWNESHKRALEGVQTDWFIFSDDDTFYPDFDSLVRLLSQYDPTEDWLIGTLSESTKQVAQWGHIAYGGAGIIVSRATLEKMNAPGVWQECLNKYGSAFGGDAMITHCAADVMGKEAKEALIVDSTLHQLDIRGDGTGFFQSGFLITSLHHWGSWFDLFPPWHESGAGDKRKGISLVGKAAKAVGGDNWGRRYVFEEGKVVVALGYSVTVEGRAVSEVELEKSEHTWWEFETFHPIRPGQEEGVEKRTYYLTSVRQLDPSGVYRLEHKNREGERVDIVWDQREKKASRWSSWKKGA
ncbi:hypothetical protein JCM8547_004350 [Rhodosporidiobolus lusitaniae]